jgi:TolB-like protein
LSLFAELKRRKTQAFVVLAILALTLGYVGFDHVGSHPDRIAPIEQAGPAAEATDVAGARPEKSIAVLPFTNRNPRDDDSGFLTDGIHDDVLTSLSRIRELKVIAHTSVMTFRGTTKSVRQIGDELGVGTLLEGTVQQTGDRLAMSVQLIDTRDDKPLWADSWDREFSTESMVEIQQEIARAVAVLLEVTLSPEENEAMGHLPTTSLEAYRAVLMARQALRQSAFGFPEAAEYARKAIELDPDYADAHLALAYALAQGIYSGSLQGEGFRAEISTAIDTAETLRPGYDEAWSALGRYQAANGQASAAESFDRAIQLNPGNVQTLFAYGNMLLVTGRPDLALPLLFEASERDPLSQLTLFSLARAYDALEKPEESRVVYARIREFEPASALGYAPVSGTYYSQGQLDLALYWLDQGQTIDPEDFELAGWMVLLYDSLEDYAAAAKWSAWLDNWVTNQPQPMAMQAAHQYQMGNFETAVQYSNLSLRLGLPDRGGSDAIFMRIKRDEALASGDPESGIEVFRSQHPDLFEQQILITDANLQQAVDLAFLFKLAGRTDEMRRLLGAAVEFYDQPWAVTGSGRASLVSAKAEALAILDDERGALNELRRIIDKGWRLNWRWETELNFNFNGIRKSPEFRAMVTDLQADMAFQRANVDAMAARGDIRQPPRK